MYIFDCAEPHKLSILTAADDSRNLKKGVKYWLKIKHHTISVFNCRKFEICYFPQGLVLRNVAMVLENFKRNVVEGYKKHHLLFPVYSRLAIKTFCKRFSKEILHIYRSRIPFLDTTLFSIPCGGEKGPPLAGMFFYHFSETFKIILYLELLKMY